jgi:UDP-glucuronate 4-epimerase
MANTFLVTGSMGCIGAWTILNLLRQKRQVVGFDLSADPYRLKLLMSDEEIGRIPLLRGDISDFAQVERVVLDHGITHIVHLAALQVPFCKADPVMGSRVNVVGTVNVLEAAARHPDLVRRVVYASSVAVYGPPNLYSSAPVDERAPLFPATHYGVYKQANEGTARIYFEDKGVNSIGLRPYVVYGVGRDRGLTSTPTKAMLAAALGRRYEISYSSRVNLQWADDASRTFIAAATVPFEGAGIWNLGGSNVDMRELVRAIEEAAPDSKGRISFAESALPFPEELDGRALKGVLPVAPETPLVQGVRATVNAFRDLAARQRIDVENALA